MDKTIAFSNSKNVWTSRYTFVSSCIGWIRSFMVSSPALVNTNSSKLFWRHDESSSDNNNFYGLQADSVIGVSFNDNPSANKQFKSFSIESSDPENISGLNTFQVNKGGTNYIPKETEIGVVKQKGGIIYGHIGEDKKITASNISFMGVVKSIQGLFDDTEDLPLEEAEELYSNAGNSAGYKYIKLESVESIPNTASEFKLLITSQFGSFKNNPSGAAAAATTPSSGTVYYKGGIIITGANTSLSEGDAVFIGYINSNGDSPKGQYADAVVSLGSDDFEVYALNVEYSPTNLDHNN